MKGGYGLMYDVKDTAKINRIFERKDVQGMIPSTMKFLWAVKPTKVDEFSTEELLELYAVKTSRGGRAPLTGEVITDARQDLDQSARPAVSMQMNATGAKTSIAALPLCLTITFIQRQWFRVKYLTGARQLPAHLRWRKLKIWRMC
jgi:hypothetical protein